MVNFIDTPGDRVAKVRKLAPGLGFFLRNDYLIRYFILVLSASLSIHHTFTLSVPPTLHLFLIFPKESLHFPPLFSASKSHLLLLDTSQGSQVTNLMVLLNRYDYEGKRSDFALYLSLSVASITTT